MNKLIITICALCAFVTSNAQKGTGGSDTTKQKEELVAQPAEYNGGAHEMYKYIRANLKYPPVALKDSIQGKVIVGLIVDGEGKISNVKIIKGLSKECDEEAIRLVKSMPNWIPGRDKNKAIVETATSVTIPFYISRQNNQKAK